MLLEDRVASTSWLSQVNKGTAGWAQLGSGILDQLDPLGLHVALPAGHVQHGGEPLLLVHLLLHPADTSAAPLEASVVMPVDLFEQLPTAFGVLTQVSALLPTVVAELDSWAGLLETSDGTDEA